MVVVQLAWWWYVFWPVRCCFFGVLKCQCRIQGDQGPGSGQSKRRIRAPPVGLPCTLRVWMGLTDNWQMTKILTDNWNLSWSLLTTDKDLIVPYFLQNPFMAWNRIVLHLWSDNVNQIRVLWVYLKDDNFSEQSVLLRLQVSTNSRVRIPYKNLISWRSPTLNSSVKKGGNDQLY